MNQTDKHQSGADDRLPLRWGVILAVSVGAGAGVGLLGGPVPGIATSIAVLGLLANIIGD